MRTFGSSEEHQTRQQQTYAVDDQSSLHQADLGWSA
jgi:hypothetical protein